LYLEEENLFSFDYLVTDDEI